MRDEVRLREILRAAADGAEIVARGREAFEVDPILQRAAKNVVTEIGEAAVALDPATIESMPQVPWREIRGMRNTTVHRYWQVDLDIVWSTLADDLPGLATTVEGHLPPVAES